MFHEKLAILCEDRGWKPIEVAKRLPGIGKSKVYNWFSGKTVPDIREAKILATVLGADIGFLADDDLDAPDSAGLTDGDRLVLGMVRAHGLSADEAARAIAEFATRRHLGTVNAVPGTPPVPPGGNYTGVSATGRDDPKPKPKAREPKRA